MFLIISFKRYFCHAKKSKRVVFYKENDHSFNGSIESRERGRRVQRFRERRRRASAASGRNYGLNYGYDLGVTI